MKKVIVLCMLLSVLVSCQNISKPSSSITPSALPNKTTSVPSSTVSEPPLQSQTEAPVFKDRHSDGSPVFSIKTVIYGSTPADKPGAPGDKYLLSNLSVQNNSKVIISGVTSQAKPDESIVIEGEGFSDKDQKVFIYYGTADKDKNLVEAKIINANATTITAVIPKSIPYSLYQIYVENHNGKSSPVYVNRPRIWWISQTNGKVGDKISVYGSNLTYLNENKQSYVYLHMGGEDAAEKSVAAKVTYADPYKVIFEIPQGLKEGYQYEVWLHNGHGGELGWAYAPQYLTITKDEPLTWKGKTIKVSSFTSDAIQEAINVATDGDTVLFPAGTYKLDKPISISKSSIRFLGEGRDKSIFITDSLDKVAVAVNTLPFQIENMGFKDNRPEKATPAFFEVRGDNYDTGALNLVVINSGFEFLHTPKIPSSANAFLIYSVTGINFSNNNFLISSCMFGENVSKVFFNNNNVVGNFLTGKYDGSQQVHLKNCKMIDISSNVMQGEDKITDPNGDLKPNDSCINRSVVFHGSASEIYIASNSIDRAGSPVDNSGEQIMFEAPFTTFMGKATAMSDTELTFNYEDFNMPVKGDVVTILNGKGEAQYRHVLKAKDKLVIIDFPWTVQPDADSMFALTKPFENVVVYNNKINGFKNFKDEPSAGCGIQVYGNMLNFFATKNEFSNYHHGLILTTHYTLDGFGPEVNSNHIAWAIVEDNNIHDVRRGITALLVYEGEADKSGTPKVHTMMNCVIRRNTISNVIFSPNMYLQKLGGDGIAVGSNFHDYSQWPETKTYLGDWIRNTVLENNKISNSAGPGIRLQKHQGETILRNNMFKNTSGGDAFLDPNAVKAIIADERLPN